MSRVSIPQPKLYTAADIERFDSQGLRYLLVYGKLEPMTPSGDQHGRDTLRISIPLAEYVESNNLGECFAAETGYLLTRDPDTVLAPDLSYVRQSRLPNAPTGGFIVSVPDLVVETRSPGDSKRAISAKIERWLGFGVGLVLDLDPVASQLTVYRPGHGPVTLGSANTLEGYDVLPGFSMPMSRVFR